MCAIKHHVYLRDEPSSQIRNISWSPPSLRRQASGSVCGSWRLCAGCHSFLQPERESRIWSINKKSTTQRAVTTNMRQRSNITEKFSQFQKSKMLFTKIATMYTRLIIIIYIRLVKNTNRNRFANEQNSEKRLKSLLAIHWLVKLILFLIIIIYKTVTYSKQQQKLWLSVLIFTLKWTSLQTFSSFFNFSTASGDSTVFPHVS